MLVRSPLVSAVAASRLRRWGASAACLAIVLTGASAHSSGSEPLSWFGRGGPTPAAREAVALLSDAAAEGLEARDYGVKELQESLESAGGASELSDYRIARLDAALTAALRRYLVDLRLGRVDPHRLGEKYEKYTSASGSDFDPDVLLQSAVAEDRLAEALRSAAPRSAQYDSLRQALASYRRLVGHPAWQQDLPPLPAGKLAPGQAYAGTSRLAERLSLLGDLPPETAVPPRYEGKLVDGMKSFQERHGMAPDGVIGRETFEQLKVTPEVRVEQLELALERLRWMPLPPAGRIVVVNVPEFMLRGYLVGDGRIEPGPAMRVIVGDARRTRTPLFDAQMRAIEFSPYWNVPPSITRGETLPRLRRDPGFFDRQGFELVDSEGRVISGLPEGSLDALERGQVRIRQRPGAANALGDIKFVFPNGDNIYFHHTSSPQLFKRDRRDFSHGCIRVEAPAELAQFILGDELEWPRERIVQAMRKGRSMTIRLKETLPVRIAYDTAAVRNGRVHFFPDIYGRDRVLRDALRQRSISIRADASPPMAIGLKAAN